MPVTGFVAHIKPGGSLLPCSFLVWKLVGSLRRLGGPPYPSYQAEAAGLEVSVQEMLRNDKWGRMSQMLSLPQGVWERDPAEWGSPQQCIEGPGERPPQCVSLQSVTLVPCTEAGIKINCFPVSNSGWWQLAVDTCDSCCGKRCHKTRAYSDTTLPSALQSPCFALLLFAVF